MEWAWNWAIRLESERKSWGYQHRDHVQIHESLWSYMKGCLRREACRVPACRLEEDKEKRKKQGFREKKSTRCSKYRELLRNWVGKRQTPEIQCFSTFLTLRAFDSVPHVVVTPTINLFSLLLHGCDFAAVMNRSADIWYEGYLLSDRWERVIRSARGLWPPGWEIRSPTTPEVEAKSSLSQELPGLQYETVYKKWKLW